MDRFATRPLLTVAVTAANENDGLRKTLAATRPSVDEIVVCDSGEAESGAPLVAEFEGRYIAQPWCDSYSFARNECLRHARGRWILHLDPGETMSSSDLAELRTHLAAIEADRAFMLLVKLPPVPNVLDGEQAARIRVFPNRPEIRYQGRVRESVRPSLERLALSIDGLPFRIDSDSQVHDPDRRHMRAQCHIELADLELRESGPQPRLLNCMAEAFGVLGQPLESATFYRRVIDGTTEDGPELLEAYYGLLTLEETNQDSTIRMDLALRALARFPLDMQLLCAMGGYLQASGRWDLALRSYETAYRFGQIQPEVWHLDQLRAVAAECYALSLQLQGDVSGAQAILEEAIGAEPTSDRLHRQLLELLVKSGQREGALRLVSSRPVPTGNLEAMRSAVRGACLASQRNWISARAYLQVAYQAGCRDSICLRWLAVTLMAANENLAAVEILREWQKLEPSSVEPARYLEAIDIGLLAAAPSASLSGSLAETSGGQSGRQIRVDANSAETDRPHALGQVEAPRSQAARP